MSATDNGRNALAATQGVETTVLGNGLKVVTQAYPYLGSAALGVWVDAGGRYETPALHGVAHLLEHMAFKGTKRRSARQIAEEIEAVGGHLNAYTGREHTAYYARVLKEYVPLAIDVIADILQHSSFDEAELTREKAVILQEIGQAEDTPDDIIFDRLHEAAYPNQAYGQTILGTAASVTAIDRSAIRNFLSNHYLPGRMVLVATGAVDHDDICRLAEAAFVDLPAGTPRACEAAHYVGGEHRHARALEQAHFALSLPGVAFQDEHFYAVQILATLLGGGMSSRLFQELREKQGLCYSIFAFATSSFDSGTFSVYAGTSAEDLDRMAAMLSQHMLATREAVDPAEVARARAQLKAATLMGMESPGGRAEQIARQSLIFGRVMETIEIVDRIEAVDCQQVCAVANRLFTNAPLTLAALGPIEGLADYAEIQAQFQV